MLSTPSQLPRRGDSDEVRRVEADEVAGVLGRLSVRPDRRSEAGGDCERSKSGPHNTVNPLPHMSCRDDPPKESMYSLDSPIYESEDESPLNSEDEEPKLTAEEEAVRYFVRALRDMERGVNIVRAEEMLSQGPESVQGFMRDNFPEGLITFFRKYCSDFRVAANGNILIGRLCRRQKVDRVERGMEKSAHLTGLTALAERTNVYLSSVLRQVKGGISIGLLEEMLKDQNPMLFNYCNANYGFGLRGFLGRNCHLYNLSGSGKTVTLNVGATQGGCKE